MNETLCRALLQAGLTEEDVAARLQVDPKTVRRWLEGRLPYLRYRWALAAMVGLHETDLWPQLRSARSRPGEVQAVYPHLDAVPEDVWLRLFSSAEREIGILADTAQPIATHPRVLAVLAQRAAWGVHIRFCLAHPGGLDDAQPRTGQHECISAAEEVHGVPSGLEELRQEGQVEIRLHRSTVYAAVYFADDQLLVSQQAYGVPPAEAPVLHLHRTGDGDISPAYLASFTDVWSTAKPRM